MKEILLEWWHVITAVLGTGVAGAWAWARMDARVRTNVTDVEELAETLHTLSGDVRGYREDDKVAHAHIDETLKRLEERQDMDSKHIRSTLSDIKTTINDLWKHVRNP